jgi:glycosyltransferase involved in cell wall biosynthesis
MWFLPRCLRKADARIFTHQGYKNLLLKYDNDGVLISPAIWINKADIRTMDSFTKARLSIDKNNMPLRIIFPSRLIKDKGVFLIFDALEELKKPTLNLI